MSTSKVAITVEEETLRRIDELVANGVFANRSKAFQAALEEKIQRIDRFRLAKESSKLNQKHERKMSEEGLSIDNEEWPEY